MSRTTVIHRSLLPCLCLVALLGLVSACVQPLPGESLNQVGFNQQLNERILLDLIELAPRRKGLSAKAE